MNKQIRKASFTNIYVNIFLTFLNISVGVIFSSISFISKGLESLQDVLVAIVIHYSIKINNKESDEDHPFGHTRAENIVGYTIGIIMCIVGIQIVIYGTQKILNPTPIIFNNILFVLVGIAFIIKVFLYFYIKSILKTNDSPSLKANLQDHINDILTYIGLFLGVIGMELGFKWADPAVAIVIGIIILISGINICRENTAFLMGRSASRNQIDEIKKEAKSIEEVLEVNLCKTQYLGNKLQVEIHIALNSQTHLKEAHDIANKVRDKIKENHEVISCFVHIDPYINIIEKYN